MAHQSNKRDSQSEGSLLQKFVVGLAQGLTGHLFDKLVSFKPVSYVKQHATPGDLLEFDRDYYSHYALYLGQGKVMNIDAEDKKTTAALIRVRALEVVCGDSQVRVRNHDDVARKHFQASPKTVYEIIRSAVSYEKKVVPYEFIFRNCEYYSTLWRYGKGFSTQVSNPTSTPTGTVLGAVVNSTTGSDAFLGAAESFLTLGGYAKYKKLATMNLMK